MQRVTASQARFFELFRWARTHRIKRPRGYAAGASWKCFCL